MDLQDLFCFLTKRFPEYSVPKAIFILIKIPEVLRNSTKRKVGIWDEMTQRRLCKANFERVRLGTED